jgi:phage protein D
VVGPEGRSFLHETQRFADEMGATFKMQGDTAVFAKQGEGKTPAGATLPTITAQRPGNMISWDIEPYDAREVFRDVRVRRFDRKTAKFVEEKVDIESEGAASASAVLRGTRADEDDAKATGEGRKTKAERDKGGGTVEIDIDPTARAEGKCQVPEPGTASTANTGSKRQLTRSRALARPPSSR